MSSYHANNNVPKSHPVQIEAKKNWSRTNQLANCFRSAVVFFLFAGLPWYVDRVRIETGRKQQMQTGHLLAFLSIGDDHQQPHLPSLVHSIIATTSFTLARNNFSHLQCSKESKFCIACKRVCCLQLCSPHATAEIRWQPPQIEIVSTIAAARHPRTKIRNFGKVWRRCNVNAAIKTWLHDKYKKKQLRDEPPNEPGVELGSLTKGKANAGHRNKTELEVEQWAQSQIKSCSALHVSHSNWETRGNSEQGHGKQLGWNGLQIYMRVLSRTRLPIRLPNFRRNLSNLTPDDPSQRPKVNHKCSYPPREPR